MKTSLQTVLIYLLLALLPAGLSSPVGHFSAGGIMAAWADDGGDGGDGDGGGGGDDGDDGGSAAGAAASDGSQTSPAQSLAVAAVDGADAVRAEVLGIALSRSQINQVRQRGFSIIRSAALNQSGLSYSRLAVPPGLSAAQAVALLNAEVAPAQFDFNHIYRLAQSACKDRRCADRQLVAWPSDQSERCRIRVRVGMIDTGVSAEFSGVAPQRLTRRSFHGGQGPSDTDHGSAVAALLAGQGHGGMGLLPHSTLIAADVFSPHRDGSLVTTAAAMAEAMDWLIASGARVINVSVTGPDNRLLQRSLEAAARQSVVVVASAGNAGPRARPAFPAAYPQAIAVTAVDARRRLYAKANRGDHIALAAPGVAVFVPTSAAGSYRTGTSFAAPYVTASVAVLQAQGIRNPADIEKALRSSVVDLGTKGRDPLFGWGLLRAPAKCP